MIKIFPRKTLSHLPSGLRFKIHTTHHILLDLTHVVAIFCILVFSALIISQNIGVCQCFSFLPEFSSACTPLAFSKVRFQMLGRAIEEKNADLLFLKMILNLQMFHLFIFFSPFWRHRRRRRRHQHRFMICCDCKLSTGWWFIIAKHLEQEESKCHSRMLKSIPLPCFTRRSTATHL